ncbi:MAG: OmpA family protein [Leptospirales bacterium]
MKNINTSYHELAPSVAPDGSFMVFYSKREKDRYNNIYISQFENDEWAKPAKFQVLNSPYNDEAPYIARNGKVIIFTSDRDGSAEMAKNSKGQIRVSHDLYWSHLVKGQWTRPVKIPGKVNTAYHEKAPSLSHDGKIVYFSRYEFGHIQNAQLMYANMVNGSFEEATEFPEPINSPDIEISLIPDENDQGFYFSSNRPEGEGSFDIYYVSHREGEFGLPVNLGPPINTDQAETYFSIYNDRLFYSRTHESESKKLHFDILSEPVSDDIFLRFTIKDISTKKNLSVDVKFRIPKPSAPTLETTKTSDKDGKLMLKVDHRPEYIDIFIEKEGYLPYYKKVLAVDYRDGVFPIVLQPIEKNRSFTIQSIHFDHNSDQIQEESYVYLDRLAAYLKKHQGMKLKIIGHTDLIGKEEFNLKLSQKRASSVKKYLVDKGVTNKLKIEGAGETRPVINNKEPKANRLNRRTEFKVIDVEN